LENFKQNLPFIRQALVAPGQKYDLKNEITAKIYDENFLERVKEEQRKIEPLCHYIDIVQSDNCNVGESLHEWLKIPLPTNNIHLEKHRKREQYIKHKWSEYSYILNPKLKGDHLLNNDKNRILFNIQNDVTIAVQKRREEHQMEDGQQQQHEQLDSEFFVVEDYMSTRGIFNQPALKALEGNLQKYWECVRLKYPVFGEFGHKFSSLPSGTAELERLFSNEAFIHNKVRNRLGDDRVEKLLLVYNTLRYLNPIEEDEEVDA
jgi:hypothetical protein